MRHFQKLAENINVVPLLNALAQRPDLWNEHTLRTTHPLSPHKQTDDIWVMFNDCITPETVVDDCEVIPYRAWYELPGLRRLVLDLMRLTDGVRLGRVLISRLAPGREIPEHTDQGAPATYYRRYHLALKAEPGCLNRSAEEVIQYRMGELWWFDNAVPHSVVNNSADDRITLVMDVRPC